MESIKKVNRILSFIKKKIMPIYVLFFKEHIYKKYIKGDYDLEIAFLEGPITRLFTGKNNKTKKIVWVHNDISKVFGNGLKSKIKKILLYYSNHLLLFYDI